MKIQVGMYCYNKTNRKLGIGKIISFQSNNNVQVKYKNSIELVSIGNVETSYNLIDLIKEGDIIEYDKGNYTVIADTFYDDEQDTLVIDDLRDLIPVKELEIKSIVTKEQFEVMEYKVGE